jgi:transcriptional regulator with XRE-family HTH domain
MAQDKPIFPPNEDRQLDAQSGQMLRSRRIDAGLSQKSLAISLGITPGYLCELERGTRILRVSMWNRAAAIINEHAKTMAAKSKNGERKASQ